MGRKDDCLSAQVIILGEQGTRESNGQQAMQGEVAEILLTMEGVQVNFGFGFLLHQFSISGVFVFPQGISLSV